LPKWLTGTEAIKHLNVGRATFYRLVKDRKITAYTLPGVADPRYQQEELDALYTPSPKDEAGEKD
jgi:excisionase family DNA binding protein